LDFIQSGFFISFFDEIWDKPLPRCRSPPLQSEFPEKFRLEEKTMAYNKALEEKKWRQWKEAEEKELRRLGVDEDRIAQLRESDWDAFKVERRYYERYSDTDTYIDWQAAGEISPDIRTVQNLLDDIDDAELYRLLLSMDKLTLQIVLWRMEGYSRAEISAISGLAIAAIDMRILRLKRKIKNIL
jgi:hypothetical protein